MKCAKPTCARAKQAGGLCKSHYRLATANLPTGLVDSGPVRRHIGALTSMGIGTRRIAELAGMKQQSVSRRQNSTGPVNSRTAARILAIRIPDAAHELAVGRAPISVAGTRRRLRALQAIGYTADVLSARAGIHKRTFEGVCGGRQLLVTAAVARSVAAVFNELQLIPGGSEITRRHSLKKGWLPPLSWDEETIDDPNAEPQTPMRSEQAEWSDTYRELQGMGLTDERIAERLGVQRESLMRRLQRLEAARVDQPGARC